MTKKSDDAFIDLGVQTIPRVPQLLALFEKGESVLLVSKIVDDFLLTGTDNALQNLFRR